MKIEADDRKSTVLDDDAYLYQKHEVKSARTRFKELSGREKWTFFKDYILLKLIIGIIILAVVINLIVTWVTPQPENVIDMAILDNPLATSSIEALEDALGEVLITDPENEAVYVDYDYYVSTDGYTSRMKLMTLLASAEIDVMLLTQDELQTYANSDIFSPLTEVMSADDLVRYEDYALYITPVSEDDGESDTVSDSDDSTSPALDSSAVSSAGDSTSSTSDSSAVSATDDVTSGVPDIYGIDVTDCIAAINGYELSTHYYLACVINSKHKESFITVVDTFFDLAADSMN